MAVESGMRSSLLLLALLSLVLTLVSCALAQSAAVAVDLEPAATPLVPDLELPPKRKQQQKSGDDQGFPTSSAPSSSSPRAKRSEGGRGFGGGSRGSGKRRRDDFDYFLFVRQYGPAICDSMSCRTSPKKQDFTIHGLWPQRFGSWPQYCNSSDRFDPKRVEPLLPRLREEWPSFGTGADAQFWGHEWMRHGTCSGRGKGRGQGSKKPARAANASSEQIDPSSLGVNEETYFGAVLDLHAKYPLLPALEAAGIVPDDEKTYAREDVVAALRADASATGATRPAVHCGSGRRGSGELTEVWLCLGKATLEPFDCPENVAVSWVGKGGDTDTKRAGCETLKLPKLKARPAAGSSSAKRNKNASSSKNGGNSKASSSGGFGAAGDAAVTLVAEKSL